MGNAIQESRRQSWFAKYLGPVAKAQIGIVQPEPALWPSSDPKTAARNLSHRTVAV